MDGRAIAILGLALCMILCGGGSAYGLYRTGAASAGVLSEDGKKFSKIIVLALLPATQGIYGVVFALIGSSNAANVTTALEGARVFAASLPLMITGLVTGIYQGKTAVGGIHAIAKNESISGKLILFPAMVETYAILGLVVSILLLA